MPSAVRLLPVAVMLSLLSACGDAGPASPKPLGSVSGHTRPVSSAPPVRVVGLRLVDVPRTVTALCRRAGQPGGPKVFGGRRHPVAFPTYLTFPPRFPIYCPGRLPAGVEAEQNLAQGRAAYQWEVSFPAGVPERVYGTAHAVLGGQDDPFPLEPGDQAVWPPAGARRAAAELQWPPRLQIVGRALVARRPALTLRFPHPGSRGGPHDGHLAIVFNIAGHGYFVSVHFQRLSEVARVALASAFAQWLERQQPIGPG
jgi:hypothetical protein